MLAAAFAFWWITLEVQHWFHARVELFQSSPGACMQSPWGWKQYGQSGKWMSDLVPHLATCVDDIAFINSIGNLGGFVGPYIVGYIREATGSFTWALVIVACFLLIAATIAATMRVTAKAQRPAAAGSPGVG